MEEGVDGREVRLIVYLGSRGSYGGNRYLWISCVIADVRLIKTLF